MGREEWRITGLLGVYIERESEFFYKMKRETGLDGGDGGRTVLTQFILGEHTSEGMAKMGLEQEYCG